MNCVEIGFSMQYYYLPNQFNYDKERSKKEDAQTYQA